MNDETPKRRRNWLPVLLATAAAAVALPVSAAVAGGGDGDSAGSGTTTEQPGFAPVQEQEREGQERRDGHDCPDRERGGQDEEGAESSTTAL